MSELAVARSGPAAAERRAAIRFHLDREIGCAPVPEFGEEQWSARISDISTSGVGVLVDRYFEPETLLALELESDEDILAYSFLVQVVRVVEKENGQWLLGCAFGRELSPLELRSLL